MDATAIFERLKARFSDAGPLVTQNPDPYITVPADLIAEIGAFLKSEPGIELDFLESISGFDDKEKLTCVYHLFSYKHRHQIVLRLERPYDDPTIPSCAGVWQAANWHEREQYDLFGFVFTGHPDLRRILLPEDWVGWPLRKAYEYPEEYHGIDHYRPDPKEQFKALDDLLAKAAAAKEKEQQS